MEEAKHEYIILKSLCDKMDTIEYKKLYYIKLLKLLEVLKYNTEGYDVCEEIILSTIYDYTFKNSILLMQGNFIEPLKFKFEYTLNCPTVYPYLISSPSIIKENNNYKCNMRAINYKYDNTNGSYISRDADGIVRTKNYIMNLSSDFLISDMWELPEYDEFEIFPCHVMGMEDVRLFGPNYFLCTRLDASISHHPVVCFGILKNNKVVHLSILGDGNKTEKNWLPMYNKIINECNIIYSFQPLTIYQLNLSNGDLNLIYQEKLDNNLDTFRGSAVPIHYKNGWLCTVHQVHYHSLRKYYHRFVWISMDFTTVKYSKNFYFHKNGVEFNLGIAHHDDGLLVTYSIDDANPRIGIVDYDYLDKLLGLN